MIFIILQFLVIISKINNVLLATNSLCSFFSTGTSEVFYTLYTKNTNRKISIDDNSLDNANFAKSDYVIIYIHGFGGSYDDIGSLAIRNGYINGTDDHNLILVDYSEVTGKIAKLNVISLAIRYAKSVYCDLPKVSKKIVDFIVKFLYNHLNIKHVHVIGVSLGAHIAGKIGSLYKKTTGNYLDRVTALDPAGPWFKNGPQINPECAKVVDVIHSNIGYYGYSKPIGTVDIYMNNGVTQPSCISNLTEVKRFTEQSKINVKFCSHGSSVLYYVASIDNKLTAKPCDEIGKLVSNDKNIFEMDDDNNNAISKTCSSLKYSNEREIVIGKHMSPS
ncbi:lipase member H-like isoform X2 [Daktulosphaira vitifoliae]|nr:lipase member H-like isoform X2 [Daktulosphaira vitifoliae]